MTFDGQMLPKKSDREFWIDITKHDNFDIDTKLHIDSHPDRFALYYFFKARSIPYIESAFVFLHKPCLERILASDVSSSHDWRG